MFGIQNNFRVGKTAQNDITTSRTQMKIPVGDINTLAPETGSIVYNSDDCTVYIGNGTSWTPFQKSQSSGNAIETVADYVIVGAGAGGTVVAARLAEAGNTVLLLESGPDTSFASTDPLIQIDLPNIQIPLNHSFLYARFGQNAASTQCGTWHATQSLLAQVSTEQNGTYYPYPRGCGAGGSSSHHAMQDGIGSLQVYDNIAALIQDDYWLGSNMQTLFTKMEHVYFPNPGPECGTSGWLAVHHSVPDQIVTDIANRIVSLTGVPYRDNFCNPLLPYGVGTASVQVNPIVPPATFGIRSYAYQDLLVPINTQTNNIKPIFDTLVSKIILNVCGSKYEAAGVEGYTKAYLEEYNMGRAHEIIDDPDNPGQCLAVNTDDSFPPVQKFLARKEVIISCGGIGTPKLLMLSGIGPQQHLTSMGIQTVLNMPGVGSDILDHCEISQVYELDPTNYLPAWQANFLISLFYDDFYAPGKPYETYYNNVVLPAAQSNPDFLSGNVGSIQWDWWASNTVETVPGETYPFPDTHTVPYLAYFKDLDFTNDLTGLNYPGSYFNFYNETQRPDPTNPLDQTGLSDYITMVNAQYLPAPAAGLRTYINFLIENLKPKVTTGTVRLQSSDPRKAAILKEQLYEDTEGLRLMAKAVLQVRNVMNDPTLQATYGPYKNGNSGLPAVLTTDFQPGPNVTTEDQIIDYIKNWSSFGHHISGGCQMGVVDSAGNAVNANTVCNSRCQVIGTTNLRIADTTVYPPPWLHAFNTVRAAYVVGEAVSDFIINNK